MLSTRITRWLAWLSVTGAATLCTPAPAQVQTVWLHDDFAAPALDATRWQVADWTLGRTHLALAPVLSNGVARLGFETFDPTQPGAAFLGTELFSRQLFSRGAGLEFSARLRFDGLPGGLVPAFFTYAQAAGTGTHEIDFEFLTSQTHAAGANVPLALTSWRNWVEADGFGQTNAHWTTTAAVAGLDLGAFNTYTTRWLPDRTEWYVNGRLVAATTQAVPNAPMAVHFNLWAPGAGWADAYSASLQPAATAGANQRWFMEVDSVTVTAVPEPGSAWLLGAGGLLCAAVLRQRRAPAPAAATCS
jgi:hypothetical protein